MNNKNLNTEYHYLRTAEFGVPLKARTWSAPIYQQRSHGVTVWEAVSAVLSVVFLFALVDILTHLYLLFSISLSVFFVGVCCLWGKSFNTVVHLTVSLVFLFVISLVCCTRIVNNYSGNLVGNEPCTQLNTNYSRALQEIVELPSASFPSVNTPDQNFITSSIIGTKCDTGRLDALVIGQTVFAGGAAALLCLLLFNGWRGTQMPYLLHRRLEAEWKTLEFEGKSRISFWQCYVCILGALFVFTVIHLVLMDFLVGIPLLLLLIIAGLVWMFLKPDSTLLYDPNLIPLEFQDLNRKRKSTHQLNKINQRRRQNIKTKQIERSIPSNYIARSSRMTSLFLVIAFAALICVSIRLGELGPGFSVQSKRGFGAQSPVLNDIARKPEDYNETAKSSSYENISTVRRALQELTQNIFSLSSSDTSLLARPEHHVLPHGALHAAKDDLEKFLSIRCKGENCRRNRAETGFLSLRPRRFFSRILTTLRKWTTYPLQPENILRRLDTTSTDMFYLRPLDLSVVVGVFSIGSECITLILVLLSIILFIWSILQNDLLCEFLRDTIFVVRKRTNMNQGYKRTAPRRCYLSPTTHQSCIQLNVTSTPPLKQGWEPTQQQLSHDISQVYLTSLEKKFLTPKENGSGKDNHDNETSNPKPSEYSLKKTQESYVASNCITQCSRRISRSRSPNSNHDRFDESTTTPCAIIYQENENNDNPNEKDPFASDFKDNSSDLPPNQNIMTYDKENMSSSDSLRFPSKYSSTSSPVALLDVSSEYRHRYNTFKIIPMSDLDSNDNNGYNGITKAETPPPHQTSFQENVEGLLANFNPNECVDRDLVEEYIQLGQMTVSGGESVLNVRIPSLIRTVRKLNDTTITQKDTTGKLNGNASWAHESFLLAAASSESRDLLSSFSLYQTPNAQSSPEEPHTARIQHCDSVKAAVNNDDNKQQRLLSFPSLSQHLECTSSAALIKDLPSSNIVIEDKELPISFRSLYNSGSYAELSIIQQPNYESFNIEDKDTLPFRNIESNELRISECNSYASSVVPRNTTNKPIQNEETHEHHEIHFDDGGEEEEKDIVTEPMYSIRLEPLFLDDDLKNSVQHIKANDTLVLSESDHDDDDYDDEEDQNKDTQQEHSIACTPATAAVVVNYATPKNIIDDAVSDYESGHIILYSEQQQYRNLMPNPNTQSGNSKSPKKTTTEFPNFKESTSLAKTAINLSDDRMKELSASQKTEENDGFEAHDVSNNATETRHTPSSIPPPAAIQQDILLTFTLANEGDLTVDVDQDPTTTVLLNERKDEEIIIGHHETVAENKNNLLQSKQLQKEDKKRMLSWEQNNHHYNQNDCSGAKGPSVHGIPFTGPGIRPFCRSSTTITTCVSVTDQESSSINPVSQHEQDTQNNSSHDDDNTVKATKQMHRNSSQDSTLWSEDGKKRSKGGSKRHLQRLQRALKESVA